MVVSPVEGAERVEFTMIDRARGARRDRVGLLAMLVLGIDAGGTKTVCQLADGSGRVLAETRGPGANLVSIGAQRVEEALRAVIDPVLADRPERIDAVCLGMAGVDQAREADTVRGVLARIGQFGQTLVVSDSLIALEAGAPDSPGVVVATGTGSIAYGRDAAGRAARAGGWGYVLADEGSGFWIGKEAIRAVLRAADRRGPATTLTGPVLRHFGVGRPQDIGREVYRDGVRPSVLAELAPLVESAAAAGDPEALRILDESARELTALAVSVVEQLNLPQGPVVLAGGMLRAAPHLTRTLVARLRDRLPQAETRVLGVEPAYGAVRLALALVRGELRVPAY
jgi:N-acetylglucosamine kinase-like BadF-type ATPase